MKLIIPRITTSTKRVYLKNFVNSVLDKWFRLPFSAPPQIISYSILSTSSSMGVIQRHGLINVTPDDAALKIIRKLNGKQLNGKRVGVKQNHLVAEGPPGIQAQLGPSSIVLPLLTKGRQSLAGID